ncbi:hypothetical protein GCM10023115_12260 [Pontixanthobacter gangjinensis]|uniref:Transcription regulator TrmB N-terminal domain-containing protein n=1 Tax=Pontixanthobacter gangjinensis TaxID=1028742 RepID=A0A6I4SMW8_9SPHN|nr:MarR family winged helix-turn-helix transcriptional regulator [Pontixanthobacter gangjinensis]MXO56470.1 hypothetical protein [Pontixanthobacter gangjinensis]
MNDHNSVDGEGAAVLSQKAVEEFMSFARNTPFDILTTEGKIYFFLLINESPRIKEVMIASNSSYRGFYLSLGKLKRKGLVEVNNGPLDGRVRRVSLLKTGT